MTIATEPGDGNSTRPQPSVLADVMDTVLDKGLTLDGYVPEPQPLAGRTGVYVYGITPGDIEVEPGAAGVGDPPGEVRTVRYRDLTALVSDVGLDRPLGTTEDLFTHEELLDAAAVELPVLPLRFGAVLAGDDSVTRQLLAAHYHEFTAALQRLDRHAEYVVKGCYAERAVFSEVLAGYTAAARPRDRRMPLGDIVADAIDAMRLADTRVLGDAVEEQVVAGAVRSPTDELDAVYAAFLVEHGKAEALRLAVERLAGGWRDRMELRLVGPLAAYDFVGDGRPAGN